MPVIWDPDDWIRWKVKKRTKDPVLQDLLFKLIKHNPKQQRMFLKLSDDTLKKGRERVMSEAPA